MGQTGSENGPSLPQFNVFVILVNMVLSHFAGNISKKTMYCFVHFIVDSFFRNMLDLVHGRFNPKWYLRLPRNLSVEVRQLGPAKIAF